MKNLKFIIPILLLMSCANPSKENLNDTKEVSKSEVELEPWEARVKMYREDLIMEPKLDTISELMPGKEYFFEVSNIPLDELGAKINNGIITRTEEGYMFRVGTFRDTVTMELFLDLDSVKHTIYSLKRKVRK